MKSLHTILSSVVLFILLIGGIVYRQPLIQILHNAHLLGEGAVDSTFSYQAFRDLQIENVALKDAAVRTQQGESRSAGNTYTEARVYSRYPFSDRKWIIIDKGSDSGIREGMPVLLQEGILVGRISAVHRTQSEVQTVFDPAWRSSSVVGASSTKSLFQGGNPPHLEFIPKDVVLMEGDAIRNVSPEYPIGLFLGNVKKMDSADGEVWKRAEVAPPYILEDVDRVRILINFP